MRLFIEQRHIDAASGLSTTCPIALAAREQFGIPGDPSDDTVRAIQRGDTGQLTVYFAGHIEAFAATIYDVGKKGRQFMDLWDNTYRRPMPQPTVIELVEIPRT